MVYIRAVKLAQLQKQPSSYDESSVRKPDSIAKATQLNSMYIRAEKLDRLQKHLSLIICISGRGGLASRATGLGPEGPPSARVQMGPLCAGRKILQMVDFG